jgi:3-oxoacyl-[acyl-carrier protein] reductase
MTDLSGRCAVVTGLSQGIGQAIAVALAGAGASVAGVHLGDPEGARRTVELVEAGGGRALALDASTGDPDAIEQLADAAAEAFGPIDVWVNNAAAMFVKPLVETSDEEWHGLLQTNLHGYMHGCRTAARRMIAHGGGGRIVNVSSVAHLQPLANLAAYITSKAGVVGLTRTLALELAPHGITVNAVAPGATESAMNRRAWTAEVRRAYRERIRSGGSPIPRRSPTSRSSSPRTPRGTSPVRSSWSTAA